MNLFVTTLGLGFGLVVILNLLVSFQLQTALDLLLCFAVVMAPAGIFLFVGRLLPKNFFSQNNKIFKVTKFKRSITNSVKVKNWKDKIPVGGHIAGFRLNEFKDTKNIDFVDRYIYESCFAEWLHLTIYIWCFLSTIILSLLNRNLLFNMVLPIAILFAFQNIVSVFIQWNVRPRVVKYRDMLQKRLNLVNTNDEPQKVQEEIQ